MGLLPKRRAGYDPDMQRGHSKMQMLTMAMVGGYPDLADHYHLSLAWCTIFYIMLIFCTIGLILSASFTILMKDMALLSEKIYHCCYLIFYTLAYFNFHLNRDSMDQMLAIIGRGFYQYSSPMSTAQLRGIASDNSYHQRFRKWYTIFLITSDTYMAWILPLIKVGVTGSWTTVTNTSVPFNTNMPLALYMPFDTSTPSRYFALFIPEAIINSLTGILILAVDTTIVNLIHQLTTQINVLTQSVNELEERARQIHQDENGGDSPSVTNSQRCFYKAFIENIKHHQVLIEYQAALQKLVELWFLVLFVGSGVTIGVSGYLITNIKITSTRSLFAMFMNIMYLADTLTVIYIYCWFSEKLAISSEEFETALYSCPWTTQDRLMKKDLNMVLTYSLHKDFRLRVSRIAVFSLDVFSQILKRAYSYVNILNATN